MAAHIYKRNKLTMGAQWFAYRPVIPAICKVSNKKVPYSSMHTMWRYTPWEVPPVQILLMDFLLKRSAHVRKIPTLLFLMRIYGFYPLNLP